MCDFGCQERLVNCKLNCGIRNLKAKGVARHNSICPFKIIRCPLGCGEKKKQAEMPKHVAEECPERQVVCPQGCGRQVLHRSLEEHITESCTQTKVKCPNECGIETLTRGAVKDHLANDCPNRLVLCRRGCAAFGREPILQAKNLQHHEENECTETASAFCLPQLDLVGRSRKYTRSRQ